MKKWLLIVGLVVIPSLLQAKTGYLVRNTDLKSGPQQSASTLKKLTKNTSVSVGERQGGWYPVTYQGVQGWVRLLHVKFGASYAKGSSGIGQATNVLSGKTSPTMATGVKGLDKASIQQASPNYQQLDVLDRYTATPYSAERFAQEGGLK